MSDQSSSHDLIDELADEFVNRRQAGEQPNVSEYCRRHPELEEEIRELFPMLAVLESAKSPADGVPGAEQIEKIGDYQILREIGRGGMGVVYEAQHRSLGRRVALKLLPPRLSVDNRALARFHREARAIAKLHHTNIVPLFEVGNDAGRFFFALQLISGSSLDRVIVDAKSHPTGSSDQPAGGSIDTKRASSSTVDSGLSGLEAIAKQSLSGSSTSASRQYQTFRWIAGLGVQAAEALDYAHRRGIIHRDVKPSNILLDESGTVWLTDFGLAKMNDDELTQTGDFVGTLRYMAPERFSDDCDERADIYGLGLTLYELLAMERAFESSDRMTLIDMICKSEPPRLRELNPRLPRDLETIVMKACDKEPRFRYQSARDLAKDLRHFIADEPIEARRTSLWEQAIRWSRRNKRLAAALATVGMLLVVIAVGTTMMSIHSSKLQHQAEVAGEAAEQRGEELKKKSDELELTVYVSQMNLAGQLASQPFGAKTIRARLGQWLPDQVGKDLRGWEWYYLYALTHQHAFASQPQARWTWEVDANPDGTKLVNVVSGSALQIRDPNTGKVLHEIQAGSSRSVDWSPDGTRIANGTFGGDITIYDAETLKPVQSILSDENQEVCSVHWSPDSKKLAACRQELDVEVWDAETGERLQTITGHKDKVYYVRWSPDGRRLASHGHDAKIRVWNASTGEQVAEAHTHPDNRYLCWSPDSKKIVHNNNIRIWDVDSGEVIAHNHPWGAASACWPPSSNSLACGGTDGVLRLLDVKNARIQREFLGHSGTILSVCWSSAGQNFVSSGLDRSVWIWNPATRNQTQILHTSEDEIHGIDWGLNGRVIVSSSGRDYFNMWEASSGKRTKKSFSEFAPEFAGTLDSMLRGDYVAFSPDGNRVAVCGRMTGVFVWDIASDRFTQFEGPVGQTDFVRWSDDGRLAALSGGAELTIWNRDGKRIVDRNRLHAGRAQGLDWNDDDTLLATGGGDNWIRVWNPETLDLVWERTLEPHPLYDVRFNSDGTRLATAHEGVVVLWDVATGEEVGRFDEIQEDFLCVDWSPDDLRLAVGSRSSVSVWDVPSRRLAIKFPEEAAAVRWSPDGTRLAAGLYSYVVVWDATRGYELVGR